MGTPILRCRDCGHGYNHQVGIRFCAACGGAVGRACRACAQLGQPEDRFCAFCGVASDASPTRREPASITRQSSDDDGELAGLVAAARQRASEPRIVAFPESKGHLDQGDLDSLFADRLVAPGGPPCV